MLFGAVVLLGGAFAAAGAPLGSGYDFVGNGKKPGEPQQQRFVRVEPRAVLLVPLSESQRRGLAHHARYVRKIDGAVLRKHRVAIPPKDAFARTWSVLQQALTGQDARVVQNLDWYQVEGEDGRGNVHFTGYFTPVLVASPRATPGYSYPLYGMPKMKGRLPSRRAIEAEGALRGKAPVLAWLKDPVDGYFLHVQGSGILEFPDGTRRKVEYAGQNNHRYTSIGRRLVDQGEVGAKEISLQAIRAWCRRNPGRVTELFYSNPSYTFFRFGKASPRGAAGVNLIDGMSIAVDTRCFPLGCMFLAEVPIVDPDGICRRHEWRVLLAHDRGGAIRGTGHVDLYCGEGKGAEDVAGRLHHYGRLYVVIARP